MTLGLVDLHRANLMAVAGDRDAAALILVKAVSDDALGRHAVPSLGFLVSEGLSEDTLARCWDGLGGWAALAQAPLSADRFPHLALLVETGLRIDPPRARAFIEDVYIPHMRHDEMIRDARGKTILFWHVPKCGGTAFNNCLAHAFYRSGTRKLPSYTARAFLSTLIRDHAARFPYLASAHVPRHRLDLPAADGLYQVLSLRDPLARAISAWRQYYSGLGRRLILPQHGSVWAFWPKADLADWARRAPPEVANKQVATFSSSRDPAEAAAMIGRLDLVFDIAALPDAVAQLSDSFGVPLDPELLGTTKNVTDKSVSYRPGDIAVLRERLAPDLALHERLARRDPPIGGAVQRPAAPRARPQGA